MAEPAKVRQGLGHDLGVGRLVEVRLGLGHPMSFPAPPFPADRPGLRFSRRRRSTDRLGSNERTSPHRARFDHSFHPGSRDLLHPSCLLRLPLRPGLAFSAAGSPVTSAIPAPCIGKRWHIRRWSVLRRCAYLLVLATILLPAAAQARPAKLIESDSDTSSLPFVSVSGLIERPKAVTYRVTMDPPSAAVISGSSDCDRGKRSVSRDFEIPVSSSTTGKAPLTISNADDCIVSMSLDYDDFDLAGTLKLELFAKKRRHG